MNRNRFHARQMYRLSPKVITVSCILGIAFLLNTSKIQAQNPQWKVFDTLNSPLSSNYINPIIFDKEGNLWVGSYVFSYGNSLIKYKNSKWTVFNNGNSSLPVSDFSSFAVDKQSGIWIGTTSQCLIFWKDSIATVFNAANSIFSQISGVFSMSIDANNVKWIGTEKGLLTNHDTVWNLFNTANSGLPVNFIIAVSVDKQGNKWIGTLSGGLVNHHDSVWFVYNQTNSIFNQYCQISSIAIDSSGAKWFATDYGLYQFNDTNWVVYNSSNSPLIGNSCKAIAFDKAGNLWLGTSGYGLWKFNGISWTQYYKYNSGLPNNNVWCIAIDEFNNKWIGTWGGGLAVFNENGVVLSAEEQISDRKGDMVYPNPANQQLTIQTDEYSMDHIDQVLVFSITGVQQKVTLSQTSRSEWRISTSDLPDGLYLVTLRYGSGKKITTKFLIKQ